MTNTTEMPVEIWVDECYWYPAELVAKEQGEYRDNKLATYTRTDTIPSKAQVAREFMDEVSLRVDDTGMRFEGAADEVLKEWEDAEAKTNSI